MEQKQLEAQLVALEAEFAEKKNAVEDVIRQHRMDLESEFLHHNRTVSEIKMRIMSKEKDLAALKKEYICRKAEVYSRFAEQDESAPEV
jgi:hypothetical protein